MVALLFTEFVLVADKPLSEAYPKDLNTLGDHIRKKRLDLGLFQRDVAALFGVSKSTVVSWETAVNEPLVRQIQSIIQFLGYVPYKPQPTFPEWLKLLRSCLGLSQRKLATLLGMDQSTIEGWECGRHLPTAKSLRRVRKAAIWQGHGK